MSLLWERGDAPGEWRCDLGRLGSIVVRPGNGHGYSASFLAENIGPFDSLEKAKEAGLRLANDVITEAAKLLANRL